jgi:hypothetical protein
VPDTRNRMEQRAEVLSAYLRGWRGYFGFCQTPSVLETLDQWLRRRLRSATWKQWKRGRKRLRNFANGVLDVALLPKRRVVRTVPGASQTALPSQWRCPRLYFDSLGIPRLADLR